MQIRVIKNGEPGTETYVEEVRQTLKEMKDVLQKLVASGGAIGSEATYLEAKKVLFAFNLALNAATYKSWKLELEK